jgi:hypothetical protein
LSLQLAGDEFAQAQLGRIDATLRHHLSRARIAVTNRRVATKFAPALTDLTSAIAAFQAS